MTARMLHDPRVRLRPVGTRGGSNILRWFQWAECGERRIVRPPESEVFKSDGVECCMYAVFIKSEKANYSISGTRARYAPEYASWHSSIRGRAYNCVARL